MNPAEQRISELADRSEGLAAEFIMLGMAMDSHPATIGAALAVALGWACATRPEGGDTMLEDSLSLARKAFGHAQESLKR
jgi:hypothetical protein